MSAIFELKINSLETYNTDVAENVVSIINWELIGQKNGKTLNNIGRTEIPDPIDCTSITDFEELTAEQVENWLISAVGQDEIDARKIGIECFLDAPDVPVASRQQPVKKDTPW